MIPVSAVAALPQIMQAAPAIAQATEDPKALAQNPGRVGDLLDAVNRVAGSILGLPVQGSSAQYGTVLRTVVDLVTGLQDSGADRATLSAAAARLTVEVDRQLDAQTRQPPSPARQERIDLLNRMRAEVQTLVAPVPAAPAAPPEPFHTGPIRTA
jgi:hypothetical protein